MHPCVHVCMCACVCVSVRVWLADDDTNITRQKSITPLAVASTTYLVFPIGLRPHTHYSHYYPVLLLADRLLLVLVLVQDSVW